MHQPHLSNHLANVLAHPFLSHAWPSRALRPKVRSSSGRRRFGSIMKRQSGAKTHSFSRCYFHDFPSNYLPITIGQPPRSAPCPSVTRYNPSGSCLLIVRPFGNSSLMKRAGFRVESLSRPMKVVLIRICQVQAVAPVLFQRQSIQAAATKWNGSRLV